MKRYCCHTSIVILIALLSSPISAYAAAYTLTVAGERLEFVSQPERGYVIKLAPDAGGIHALAGLSTIEAEDATPIGGLDRRGVWAVESEGPAGWNEEAIRSLRAGGEVAYAAPLFSSNGETVAVIPEIVVRVKPGIEMEEVARLSKAAGCVIRKRMEFTEREYLLDVLGPDAEAVFATVEEISQAPEVEWACPNTAFRPELRGQTMQAIPAHGGQLQITSAVDDPNVAGVFPNDEYFPTQWHLHNTGQSGGTPGADIRAPEAWEITTGDPNIVVAVLDCGVDTSHPDLNNNLVAGYDFIENDPSPDPALVQAGINAHGTMCAGLVAAQGNNSIGVTGVTWNCKVMPIRVGAVRADGSYYFTTLADSATAFRWAATHGADIFTNSWFSYPYPQAIMYSAIVDITQAGGIGRNGRGCVVVSAVANANSYVYYPTRYPEVVAVGATNDQDLRWGYSNYGAELDIMAPGGPYPPGTAGVTIWTTDIVGSAGGSPTDYGEFGGTSAAAPIAAGVAALILSMEPNLTNGEVRHFLEQSAKDLGDPGRDDYYGWGRVDARAALDMVLAKRADLNNDWKVDEQDLAILNAAIDANDLSADIAPATKRDGVVDANDRELLTRYLGTVIPEMGLIAHWKLDETEGLVVHDSVGEYLDGEVKDAPLWLPEGGKIDGALSLDGVDDYVAAPFTLDPASEAFSVFAWVKDGAPGQVILSQRDAVNWLMADAAAGTLLTELGSTGRQGRVLRSQVSITEGNWHRVGFVRDGLNRVLYVDDIEVARDTVPSLGGSTGDLYIGAGSTLSPGSFWKGLIDDVRIYNKAIKP